MDSQPSPRRPFLELYPVLAQTHYACRSHSLAELVYCVAGSGDKSFGDHHQARPQALKLLLIRKSTIKSPQTGHLAAEPGELPTRVFFANVSGTGWHLLHSSKRFIGEGELRQDGGGVSSRVQPQMKE